MIVLVGLGNPGPKFAHNRHNIGFMALDAIAERYAFPTWRGRFHSLIAASRIGDDKVLLVKPQTYMNESGRAVGDIMRFYSLKPEDIVVFHDELDLPPGKLRHKFGGGHAGHNGLRSIAAHIGPDFHRIRLGIGHPGDKNKVHAWVLKDFARADHKWLQSLIEAVADNAHLVMSRAFSTFQNKVHLALNPPPPKPAAKAHPQPGEDG